MSHHPKNDLIERIALFRHSLIARLLPTDLTREQRRQEMQRIVSARHTIPGSTRQHVAESTVRDWLRAYRHGGFDALKPKPRRDAGEPRRLSAPLTERLIRIKEDKPALAVRLIIDQVRQEGLIGPDEHLPPSTVHRLLQRSGLMTPNASSGEPADNDRRRFAFLEAGQLWMSDVMHGPPVPIEPGAARKRKTYLIAFLDDATRVIPEARFCFSENTQAFLPVFRQALIRRGLPERLYVDNGANYRSHQLALVCAKLGVALIHARPYRPEGKGKIERFFRTCRAQLLSRLTDVDTASLEALNRRLATWIEGEYHHSPHRGIDNQTPLERWSLCSQNVRYSDATLDLEELFLFESTRKVATDRTVSLNGRLFEVEAVLVGERVTLRYDPSRPEQPVAVWHEGKFVETARQVDPYANCFVRRHRRTGVIDTDMRADVPGTRLSVRSLSGNGNKQRDGQEDD